MRIHWILLVATLALAGCNGKQTSSDNGTNPPASASVAKRAQSTSSRAGAGIDSVIRSLGKQKAFVRYDRVAASKAGGKQRQVFVEMLGATDRESADNVTKAFAKQGFTVRRGKDDAAGIRLRFAKAKIEPIDVLIRSKQAGPKLESAAATSSVYFRQASK